MPALHNIYQSYVPSIVRKWVYKVHRISNECDVFPWYTSHTDRKHEKVPRSHRLRTAAFSAPPPLGFPVLEVSQDNPLCLLRRVLQVDAIVLDPSVRLITLGIDADNIILLSLAKQNLSTVLIIQRSMAPFSN